MSIFTMSLSSVVSEEPSFLHPRDPSILGWDQRVHFPEPAKKHLFNEVLEEECESSEKTGIQTYLRLKPSAVAGDKSTLSILNDTTIVTNPPKESATYKNNISGRVLHQYTFSKVFGPDTSQKSLFDECVALQIKDFILGNNCLLFAYGTTNAGKTFTIQGNGAYPGLIPRAIDLLFKSIQGQVAYVGRYKPDKVEGIIQLDSASITQDLDYKNRILQWTWDKPLEPIKSGTSTSQSNISGSSESDFISSTYREMQKTLCSDSPVDMPSDSDVIYGVWVSFAEVYNECVYDLLDPIVNRNRKRIPLKMAQDSEGNTFIRDLKMIHVSSGDEAFHVMLYGKANLQVAATSMNMRSSRSHCIFSIKLVRYANSDNPSYAIVSSFTFCDLAGAERAKKTLNAGDRLKESNNINSSLHVLGRCLATIRENQKRHDRRPVPFRDSKLTRIFQRALTGHERITMIVNANTSPILFDETVNVLKFSAIAKQIVLETPIKKSKPVQKKSRFSMLVSRPNLHGTICWDAPVNDHEQSTSSINSDTCLQKYNSQNEELLLLVEKLKEQLAHEKEKNLTLERNIRQNMTETFSKMMADMDAKWKTRLKDVEERNENLASWRIAQLEKFYELKLEGSRKRRRESDANDSIDNDNSEQEKRIQELEEEKLLLESKCNAVHELLKEARDIQATLTSENATLKFELASAKADSENHQRLLSAAGRQAEGFSNAFAVELKEQLEGEKVKLAEEIKKNENLRQLLEEAKSEFLMLTKDRDEADTEALKLQSELVKKLDELAEVNQQLEAAQLLLSQKSRAFDKVEEKYEALLKTCEKYENDLKEVLTLLKENDEAGEALKEVQTQLQSLHVSDESLKQIQQSDAEGQQSLETLSCSLLEMMKTKLKCIDKVTSDYKNLKSQMEANSLSLSLKNEDARKMQETIQDLKQQLSDLEKISGNTIKEETDLLQKDLKKVLQKNLKLEEDLEKIKAELESSQRNSDRLEQELKSVLQKSSSHLNMSVSSQIELETLGSKVKTYEETMKFITEWKEEKNNEVERLREELSLSKEENLRRLEQQQVKEAEVERILEHRSELVSRYEDALHKVQEELEREKREVTKLRDALYKSTPTPKKNESAEIRRLKDVVESLQAELSLCKRENQPCTVGLLKSARKTAKQDCISIEGSTESLKENVDEVLAAPKSSSKRTAEKKKTNSPPQPEHKPQRRARKLFSRNQTLSTDDDFEPVEVECSASTEPETYMKRTLRNRKV